MCHGCAAEILRVRHHRLLVPHDFDVSLYSAVIKPTSAAGFDRYALTWHEDTQKPSRDVASSARPRVANFSKRAVMNWRAGPSKKLSRNSSGPRRQRLRKRGATPLFAK